MPLVEIDDVVCLDFEASALARGSFPIEAAVADCATGACRSWLIRPTTRWLSDGVWSEKSAAVHNIPLQELDANGMPVERVAAELAAACAGKRVLCDGGAHDGYWLFRLFDAMGCDPPFTLEDHAAFACELALRQGRRPDVAFGKSKFEAEIAFPIAHRAGDDARHLAEVIRLIAGCG